MPANVKELLESFQALIKDTYNNWRDDRTLRLGAGLAYYVMFSIIPLLAFSLFVASIIFPQEAVMEYFSERFQSLFSSSGVQPGEYFTDQSIIENVELGMQNLGIFGFFSLLFTASFAVLALNDSVNIIWGRPVARGWKNVAKKYLFSYFLVLAFAGLLVAILVVQALLSFFEDLLSLDGPVIDFLTSTATVFVTWALVVLSLAWLIRVLSNNKVRWVYTILGSGVTVAFMYLGVKVIGWYLANFSLNSVTSAFGTVILVLLWVYYESQILLAGFQLTRTLSEKKYFKLDS